MSGIDAIITNHLEMLFWNVTDKTFDEIHRWNRLDYVFIILVPIVVKSDDVIFLVIRINAG